MIPGTFMLPGMVAQQIGDSTPLPAPEIVATNKGQTGSANSTFNAPLPAGIADGDMIVMVVLIVYPSMMTITTPSGWDEIYSDEHSGSGVRLRSAVYYKIATGDEGSTQSITASGSAFWAVNSYLIRNATNIEVDGESGTGNSADPPSLAPSFGDATVWIAAGHFEASNGSETSPVGYTDQLRGYATDEGIDIGVNVTASKVGSAASENPGAFTNTGYGGIWHALTIGIG